MLWLSLLACGLALRTTSETRATNSSDTVLKCPPEGNFTLCRRGTFSSANVIPSLFNNSNSSTNTTNTAPGNNNNDSSQAPNCTTCPAGYCCSKDNAFPCPKGYSQPLMGQDTCNKCPVNSWTGRKRGQTECTCREGMFGLSGDCIPCTKGSFCTNSTRYECPVDSFAIFTGMSACLPCGPWGNTQGLSKQPRCTCLPTAYFNSTHCLNCPKSFVCDGTGPPTCLSGFYRMKPFSCAPERYTNPRRWIDTVEDDRRFWGSLHPVFG